VLVGEASNDSGARVALIDISNLASPQVYPTTFAQISDVTLFGSTAVICGLGGYSNAFQVANTSDFPNLATSVPMTNVSAWSEYAVPFMCDFDGTNAVFSDGTGLYVYAISGGTATAITPQGGVGAATSVAIAQRLGPGNTAAGGVQLAYAAAADPNVELPITATQKGARAPVQLPNTTSPNNTLAVTVFFTFWPPWWIPWSIIASLFASCSAEAGAVRGAS
jgi:hypothetical protein